LQFLLQVTLDTFGYTLINEISNDTVPINNLSFLN